MARGRITVGWLLVLAIAACAKLANLEGSDEGAGAGSVDAGSLPTTPEGITVSPAKLAVSTACGVAGDGPSISISNSGANAVDFEIKVPVESSISLRDEKGASGKVVSGVVAPGKVAQVATRARSTKPGGSGGNIIVTTAGREQTLPVEVNITGADLAFTPSLIDFGDVRQNTATPPQMFDVRNVGNEAVTISGWTGTAGDAGSGDFSMASGSLSVPPGGTAKASATFVSGAAGGALSAEFSPTTVTPLCSVPPKLLLKGRRVNDNVTVNPGSISFGTVDCNATAPATTFTVSNYSPVTAASVTVTLQSGVDSWLTVDRPSATVPTASVNEVPGTAAFAVSLAKAPTPGTHTETISVGIAGPETSTKTVTASVMVVGAVLQFSPASLTFTAPTQKKTITVTNSGNAFIYVGHTSSSPDFSIAGTTAESALFEPPLFNTSTIDVTLIANGPGPHAADIVTARKASPFPFPTSGKLCNTAVVKATATLP